MALVNPPRVYQAGVIAGYPGALNFVGAAVAVVGGVANVTVPSVSVEGGVYQTLGTEIAVDTTTTSTGFVDLLTQAIVTQVGSAVLVLASFAVSNTNGNPTTFFRVLVDGATKRGVGVRSAAAGDPSSGVLALRVPGLAPGAHTVKLQWRTSNFTSRIRPVSSPDSEHASLVLVESAV